MEKSFVFNSKNKDRVYKAEDFTSYFASFIGNGVFPNPSCNLKVLDNNNNMSVKVNAGKGWINGYYYQNTEDFILNIDVADSILNRIDRVVLRLDFNERSINLKIKKGNFESEAKAKNLQRDADVYELALADINIKAGSTSIKIEDIKDLRLNKELCGVVHGTVEQVDTTEIFNQYEKYLNEKINSNEFADWLQNLKNKLDPGSDLALQLQLQIDSFKKLIEQLDNKVSNIELTAEKVSIKDSSNNFSSKDVEGALNELFTFADSGKKLWVDVIGNPLSKSDSFSTLKNKTNNIKSNFVTKLASKGIYKNYNDNLQNLVDSLDNIKALKIAKGSSGLTSWETYPSGGNWTAMKNLTFNITTGFQPKMILINGEYKGIRFIYPFRFMIYIEQNEHVTVTNYNKVDNAVFYYNAGHDTLIAEITPNSNGFVFEITNESWPANFENKNAFKINYTVIGG